ncbi:aminopeptidase N [Yunchengibacter salinarum]|uniref:aminopeptidase N n=1 Tax=Yunchengibacter salinarum TaxID=3133399 RepID=UPI0035B68732
MADSRTQPEGHATRQMPEPIYLADYTPPAFQVPRARLTIQFDGDTARVVSVLDVERDDEDVRDLILDGGAGLDLVSATLDGQPLGAGSMSRKGEVLTIHDVPDRFRLETVTDLKPAENTRLEGLYKSGGMFCTQCEAEGFRHITFFPDRPDVMTRFTVRLEADAAACPVLLANGNPLESGALPDGRHFAVWDDPFPKPSYLFACVAGNLARRSDSFTTRSGRAVDLHIYTLPRDADKTGHAMESLKRAMRWDEDVFDLEYDLDVYNVVAVPDFNMGAMENKGLNIFNTKFVLASSETATDRDYDAIEAVIAHEYFHNWTGNRVTCRDWFQLSLKEGLTVFRDQEFSSDMGSRAVKRINDARLMQMIQFPEDAGPMAHPVRPESYVEINNFYTPTVYNKGAEVIRMMRRLITPEGFASGMTLYFERHDGQAVTTDDFVTAMEDASGVDLGQFRRWYVQAGTPTLAISRERDGDNVHLTIRQTIPDTPGQTGKKPHTLPLLMGWIGPDGTLLTPDLVQGEGTWAPDGCLLKITEAESRVTFAGVPDGAVPSLLRDFSAPVILESDLDRRELAHLVRFDTDGYARADAARELGRQLVLEHVDVAADQVSLPDYHVSALEGLIADEESDPALLAEVLTLPGEMDCGQAMRPLRAEALHEARENVARCLAARLGDAARARYDALVVHGDTDLGPVAKARRRLVGALLALQAPAAGGVDRLRLHYDTAELMTDRISALTLMVAHDPDRKDAALDAFLNRFRDDPLVVDKWFAVQAASSADGAFDRIRALVDHPDFTHRNPNRLRSLIASFAMLNQRHFHRPDGAGYAFLADHVLATDALNPQTAARLVAPLGRFQRLGDHARDLMKAELNRIVAHPDLSRDVTEMVTRALEDG